MYNTMQENFGLKIKRAVKKVAAISTGVAMMGATMTGALAQDLADYPSPFVTSGTYDTSNALVVGSIAAASDTLGMVDIASNLQFESKVCTATSGSSVTVVGGKSEEIPLGLYIADNGDSRNFDQELADSDLPHLLDTAITFQSTEYDVSEILKLNQGDAGNVSIQTSLTSSEDDYETDIVMEVARDAIKYYYVFDETIQPNATTTADPLEIKFLGQTLQITGIDTASDTKFTARVGAEFFMNVGDTVTVDGKKVTLENVGSGGAVVVTVDGVQETIPSSGTETINGIEINNDETFYEDNKDQRSATLVIGKDAVETYADGDPYVGEDDNDPNWVWNLANLNSKLSTTTAADTEYTGPVIGIENDFTYDDDKDNPPGAGECMDLPNNYISICFDSLTVADDDYMTLIIEREASADLSEAQANLTSVPAIFISVNENEGLLIDRSQITANVTNDVKTDKVWLYNDNDSMGVYYEDTNGKTQLAGYVENGTGTEPKAASGGGFIDINFGSTKDTDVQMDLVGSFDGGNFNLTLIPFETTDLPSQQDNITTTWTSGTAGVSALGATLSTEEAGELVYGEGAFATSSQEINIGTKDEDHRTKYGIIIRDPKSNGASDQVVLEVPSDQVMANVVIKGSAASVSAGGQTCTVADITPVTMTDNEVTNPANYNLILVGGPCANSLVEELDFGVTCAGWDLQEGEAIIKLIQNGDNVAMLVAGTEALDTRRAAKVVANYKDYTLTGTEALVKGTTLTDITVE
ncbi:S-layer protein [Candidatus Woesearchaeota archaeon]|nr:S-layer protein [Candidatus Woesearchaeota archaeon]